jgi:class 3 adenylate cyclase/tetratricopeptide (TPR) repeat protein
VNCSNCGATNAATAKFCSECGTPLVRNCPNCGTVLAGAPKFCPECGTNLGIAAGDEGVAPAAQRPPAPVAERRLVTVLFVDLVGFTTLSETRDAEEVRELLSTYFDTCRTLITRYGGIVEKFIGDAVMAVWGAPVATEHDAERAVRAALELVAAVAAFGDEVGAPELQARAGVLTAEAAVNLAAQGEGMVAGDMVNTASRIQSSAPSGQVFVGGSTRRATEAAVVYEDAGTFDLKGKSEPIQLFRALRVVAGAQGSLKSVGLEAPFVGRDRELRLVKELFHSSADESRAHLVSVSGIAGIGKSRLSWEFYKYFDGLEQVVLYHRGRCLSYGEGVAYWALVEMLKMRARIAEDEEPLSASVKLHKVVEQFILDPEERKWAEPRLAHLLGLEDRAAAEKEDLFSAWRLFFERMAEQRPVLMIFEDLQWADDSLLDFIEYLLEWSRTFPIFVITLSRPELTERRPNWGASKRSFTSLYLEPLTDPAMHDLLSGLVPGLPEEIEAQILNRAEGVPLYAVETVRMLLDRGLLRNEGSVYVPTGPIDSLDVPETLHALIAARLDVLSVEERRVAQDGAVLGKTFFKEGLVRLGSIEGEEMDAVLASLVRKEILTIQTDTRSPEYGQYGFLQDLLRTVAYETLSRHDRKAKHLEAASFIREIWPIDEDEIVDVLAAHYIRAYEAVPDAPDAPEIRDQACQMLVRAGDRAASLAANGEALRHFEHAAELTDPGRERAELMQRAGLMAYRAGRFGEAEAHLGEAAAIFDAEGEPRKAAQARGRLALRVLTETGRQDEAIRIGRESFAILADGEQDEDLADLAANLGRALFFQVDMRAAAEVNETALSIAEALWLPAVISRTLSTKGSLSMRAGRNEEAQALLARSVGIAVENDLPEQASSGYGNLAELLFQRDRYSEALDLHHQALALARRIGSRPIEWHVLAEIAFGQMLLGDWNDAIASMEELPSGEGLSATFSAFWAWPQIHAARGDLQSVRSIQERYGWFQDAADPDERAVYAAVEALLARAEGKYTDAMSHARRGLEVLEHLGAGDQTAKLAFVEGIEAALAAGDLAVADEWLAQIEAMRPGEIPPYLRAQALRLRARMADAQGDLGAVESGFKAAAGLFREIGVPFWLAVTLLEHGEWLSSHSRTEEAVPLLMEAGTIFERLAAEPWLERIERVGLSTAVG